MLSDTLSIAEITDGKIKACRMRLFVAEIAAQTIAYGDIIAYAFVF